MDVGQQRDCAALHLFRRGISRRSHGHGMSGDDGQAVARPHVVRVLREPQVDQHDPTVRTAHHVLRLDVAMDKSVRMQLRHGRAKLKQESGDLRFLFRKLDRLQQFHDEIGAPVPNALCLQRRQGRARSARQYLRLIVKSPPRGGIVLHQHLQRRKALSFGGLHAIDLPAPAPAEESRHRPSGNDIAWPEERRTGHRRMV